MQAVCSKACTSKTVMKDWCRQFCPHTGNIIKTSVQRTQWHALDHPVYSPDLSHCNLHILRPMKQALKWSHFQSDTKVKQLFITFPSSSLQNTSRKAFSSWSLSDLHVWLWVVTLFEHSRYHIINPGHISIVPFSNKNANLTSLQAKYTKCFRKLTTVNWRLFSEQYSVACFCMAMLTSNKLHEDESLLSS